MRTIEVTVISAEGLLVNKKRPVKNSVSVTVRTGPGPLQSASTGVYPEAGSFPAWNDKLMLELPAHARVVEVEARSGSRVIATANIPVTDFAGGHLPEGYLSFVSYRLRDASAGKNGIVNLSVKVKGGDGGAACSRPCMAVVAAEGKLSGGVVMGIPVSYTY